MKTALLLVALFVAACGREPAAKAPAKEAGTPGHGHSAKYGGKLVELGDHHAQIEIVHDPAAGSVTLYVWNGHVDSPIPLTMPVLEIRTTIAGKEQTLKLLPVTDELTGETAGAASKFFGTAPALQGADALSGAVSRIRVRRKSFTDVAFDCGS